MTRNPPAWRILSAVLCTLSSLRQGVSSFRNPLRTSVDEWALASLVRSPSDNSSLQPWLLSHVKNHVYSWSASVGFRTEMRPPSCRF
jgi:hypothetical protein